MFCQVLIFIFNSESGSNIHLAKAWAFSGNLLNSCSVIVPLKMLPLGIYLNVYMCLLQKQNNRKQKNPNKTKQKTKNPAPEKPTVVQRFWEIWDGSGFSQSHYSLMWPRSLLLGDSCKVITGLFVMPFLQYFHISNRASLLTASMRKFQEQNETFQANRAKMAEGLALALARKDQVFYMWRPRLVERFHFVTWFQKSWHKPGRKYLQCRREGMLYNLEL